MTRSTLTDETRLARGGTGGGAPAARERSMTRFVESCVETAADSAHAAERRSRGKPRFGKLLKLLAAKKNILVTTHLHPDPDALASSYAITQLLTTRLPNASVQLSVKGRVGGGLNEAFVKHTQLNLLPWDDDMLGSFDAIIMLDTQPSFAYNPLPAGVQPLAVIDHHRGKGGRVSCPFCDIRPDVGSTSSIVFSYFMETETPISAALAATLLYAIETDLAGAAGTPDELDNIALASLTLLADTRKLYQMRYVDLPQSYYIAYSQGLATAMFYENALVAHLDAIDSLEKPAVIADFLLRFEGVQLALVTGIHDTKMILSLRSSLAKVSAAQVMRRLVRGIGEGGGHRNKAGGYVLLETCSAAEIERKRAILLRRYLRAVGIKGAKGQRLVPKAE
jgi:nanoRNase/pAp phosphatase (c-di-AMP/oligoRNAs hydrolase)